MKFFIAQLYRAWSPGCWSSQGGKQNQMVSEGLKGKGRTLWPMAPPVLIMVIKPGLAIGDSSASLSAFDYKM